MARYDGRKNPPPPPPVSCLLRSISRDLCFFLFLIRFLIPCWNALFFDLIVWIDQCVSRFVFFFFSESLISSGWAVIWLASAGTDWNFVLFCWLKLYWMKIELLFFWRTHCRTCEFLVLKVEFVSVGKRSSEV